jgi:ABC-type multidrug transport system ATPase subunit
MIRAEGLRKRFGPVVALDDVSLHVAPGEAVVLLGPNGAGKTTLLRAIAGLAAVSSGRLTLAGVPVPPSSRTVRRFVGIVPQRTAFPRTVTVREFLASAARLRGVDGADGERVMARLALAGSADRRVHDLSGGMQQRVAIAQALLGDPPVLLLDEPTTGLDPASAHGFRALLAEIKGEGKTIVMSTHLLNELASFADRIGVMQGGRLVAYRAIQEVGADLEGAYLDLVGARP